MDSNICDRRTLLVNWETGGFTQLMTLRISSLGQCQAGERHLFWSSFVKEARDPKENQLHAGEFFPLKLFLLSPPFLPVWLETLQAQMLFMKHSQPGPIWQASSLDNSETEQEPAATPRMVASLPPQRTSALFLAPQSVGTSDFLSPNYSCLCKIPFWSQWNHMMIVKTVISTQYMLTEFARWSIKGFCIFLVFLPFPDKKVKKVALFCLHHDIDNTQTGKTIYRRPLLNNTESQDSVIFSD